MEHSVLCGSKEFPVKDPFVELVKGSLNTFLNAMTYPDKTVYPVASCNDKDFQNLMHVYMDAVFYPNIYQHDKTFRQEGWSYKLDDPEGELTISGVVYNEMKGAFSSPEGVLDRVVLNSLFPDNAYSVESGGDPEVIPELTYEQFLDFHRKYYHPSNSYIYLYGNMDMEEKLAFLDEHYLSHFDYLDVDSVIQEQKAFGACQDVTLEYPVAENEGEEDNTYLSYNTVIETALDEKLYLAFDILDYALVSAPGAPLKQALIDAGIGSEITGGYDSGTLQPTFSVIAKNTNPQEKEHFLAVIRETLEGLVKNGLNKKSLLAGINSSEFRYREADFGHFPKGLLYGIQCLDSWLFDDMQPFMHLEALDTYQFLKDQIGTGYYEELVKTYLLDNPHASVVITVPEQGLGAKRDAALEKKLAEYKAGLSREERKKLIADTKHLKQYQEEPSPKEDLEKIPRLTRADLKKEAAPLLNREIETEGVSIIAHEMDTNGIDYLTYLFDVCDILPEDLPYLGILKAVLGYVDTDNHSYAALANEINMYTGGIGSSIGIYPNVKKQGEIGLYYEVRTKVLASRLPDAMRLIKEILLTSHLSDEKRLYEILAQLKSRLQAGLSASGHSVAYTRALSYFSAAAYCQDATAGIACYRVIADYEEHFEEKKQQLMEKLSSLVKTIFTAERMLVSATCEESEIPAVTQASAALKNVLYVPDQPGKNRSMPSYPLAKKNEGFMDASQVQYVARAGNYAAHGFSYHGALRILKVILGYDYLWINVRVKGGAYGCMNGYMRNGDTYFVSYRDPNLSATNEIYDGIPAYLEKFDADEREMTGYIIGTISDMDTPMNPSAKGARSMTAYLQELDYETLSKERSQIIGAQPADIRALKPLIASVLSDGSLCVIGNEDVLTSEKQMFETLESLT